MVTHSLYYDYCITPDHKARRLRELQASATYSSEKFCKLYYAEIDQTQYRYVMFFFLLTAF